MRFNEIIKNLPVYEAGKPIELVAKNFKINPKKIIKLASNENPFGSSPLAIKAIKKAAKRANLYPDDSYHELKNALAKKFELKSENFIIGSGSDEVIEFALGAVCNDKLGILTAGVSFGMYGVYASHIGAPHFKTKSQKHDLAELLELYEKHKNSIGVVILCLPNNPLGECENASEIENFITKIDKNTLIMLDCAYMEFASFKDSKKAINPKKLVRNFENVLYLGTFSKAYGLGGMRVGYGIANDEIIKSLHKLRPPFNISTPSLACAIAALNDENFIIKTLKNNLQEMKKYENFANKKSIEFIPSYTNFITFKLSDKYDSTKLCDVLLSRGIILRNLKSYDLNAVRITIGTKAQNKKVLKELDGLFS